MRESTERFVDRWWRANGRQLLLLVGVAAVLVLLYPADLDSKLVSAGFALTVAFAASLLHAPRRARALSRKELFESVAARKTAELPGIKTIDRSRPLLATGGSNAGPVIYLVRFDELTPGLYLLPALIRGRRPSVISFGTVKEARAGLASRGIGVIAQSDFTDRVAQELFFDDEDS